MYDNFFFQLHAEYNKDCDEYKAHRVLQAFDTAQFIRMTCGNADFIILAGDLNTEPEDISYKILTSVTGLIDSYTLEKNNTKDVYTNQRYQNSYTEQKLIQDKFSGARIDYIMFLPSQNTTTDLLKYEHPLPDRVPGKNFSYSDHEAVAVTLKLKPSKEKKPSNASTEQFKSVITEAVYILNEAITNLHYQKLFYIVTSLILFTLLIFCCFIDAPFNLKLIYFVLKLIICGFLSFTFIMGTGWNNIEYNALLSTKLSMEYYLKQSKNKENTFNLF